MNKLNVCVFFSKKNGNNKSIDSASVILNALNSEKYTTIPIFINESGNWFLYDGSIGSILDIDIERVGTKAILSPDTSHKGLIRIVSDKNRVIPIDIGLSLLFSFEEEMLVRSILLSAKIPFVGLSAFDYANSTDFFIKKLIADNAGIKMIESIGYNESVPFEEIYEEVKLKMDFPVLMKSSNNIFNDEVYCLTEEKEEFLDYLEKSFENSKNIVVQKSTNFELITILFFNKKDKLQLFTPLKQTRVNGKIKYTKTEIKNGILEKLKNICIKLVEIFSIREMCAISLYIDYENMDIYFEDINTNLLFAKNDVLSCSLENDNVSVKEFLETLINWSFKYEKNR